MSSLLVMLIGYSIAGGLIVLGVAGIFLYKKINKEKIVYDREQIKSPEEWESEHPESKGFGESTRTDTESQSDNTKQESGRQGNLQDESDTEPSSDSGNESEDSETDKQSSSSVPELEQDD